MTSSKKEEDKKEKQVDNLINIVENYTRTERHLEQYSHIGKPEYKEMAREKQTVRIQEAQNLKEQLMASSQNNSCTSIEQLQNTKEQHQRTKNYIGNNYETMDQEQIRNMAERQVQQSKQIQNLEENLDF